MKLLQKTIRNYLLYSVFVLLIAIPAFYFVIQNILRHEIDEELLATKYTLKAKILQASNSRFFQKTGFLDDNMKLSLSNAGIEYDSLWTTQIYDSLEKELIPFRIIESNFLVNGQPYLLHRKRSLIENDDLIKSILAVEILLLIFLLGGLFFINRYLSKKIWRPFYATLDKLRTYNVEKHTNLNLSKSSVAEFDDLNKSLEELTDRTNRAFLSQKEFTENASHEMQTPLAILQGILELLMQTSPLSEAQAELMDQLSDASERLARLNKSLILLTRIENNQFGDVKPVCLKTIIETFSEQYRPQIEQKQLSVILEQSGDVILAANKLLIEILVSNLFGNAIRHNQQNGIVRIFFGNGLFKVSNTGKPLPLDEQKIFMRFQKESADENSIGLGLAIAKKICSLYNYSISYRNEENLHEFVVIFD